MCFSIFLILCDNWRHSFLQNFIVTVPWDFFQLPCCCVRWINSFWKKSVYIVSKVYKVFIQWEQNHRWYLHKQWLRKCYEVYKNNIEFKTLNTLRTQKTVNSTMKLNRSLKQSRGITKPFSHFFILIVYHSFFCKPGTDLGYIKQKQLGFCSKNFLMNQWFLQKPKKQEKHVYSLIGL